MPDFIPLEADEQKALVHWLRVQNIKHFRVPNETYTKSWKQKSQNKALGVVAGVPDMFVLTNTGLIAIEMKRVKGSVTSPQQAEWIEALNAAGVPAYVCKGVESAIQRVKQHHYPNGVEF